LPIGRFPKSKSLGGNRVILGVRRVETRFEMVASARKFVDGEFQFSALVDPIASCKWWFRVNGEHSAINVLTKRWELLVDRTWNEYGQHANSLTVDEMRQELLRDIEVWHLFTFGLPVDVRCPQYGSAVVKSMSHASAA
jgi:hypothetical protein